MVLIANLVSDLGMESPAIEHCTEGRKYFSDECFKKYIYTKAWKPTLGGVFSIELQELVKIGEFW